VATAVSLCYFVDASACLPDLVDCLVVAAAGFADTVLAGVAKVVADGTSMMYL